MGSRHACWATASESAESVAADVIRIGIGRQLRASVEWSRLTRQLLHKVESQTYLAVRFDLIGVPETRREIEVSWSVGPNDIRRLDRCEYASGEPILNLIVAT